MTENNFLALNFFKLVPPALMERACIAGGAAVDFVKANDVDIWILTPDPGEYDEGELRDVLRAHLKTLVPDDPFSLLDTVDFTERLMTDAEEKYGFGQPNDGKVLFEGDLNGKKFQILVARFQNVAELLEHFDLSVHQAAWLPAGSFVTRGTTTKPGVTIRVTNYHSPVHTFSRLRKLCRRYSSDVSPMNVATLVHATDAREAREKQNGVR